MPAVSANIQSRLAGAARQPSPRVGTLSWPIVAVLPIRIVGDPLLHKPTNPVEVGPEGSVPEDVRKLIADMYETMAAANGVGLAANQVGVPLRLFVYDCAEARGKTVRRKGVVINPVLETSEVPETMPDPENDEEGCLSVPGEAFPTGRAKWARVTGLDADGAPVTLEGEDLFARMLQHETGHLDGLVYLDRLVGRHARSAKRMLKSHGWGEPGLSWTPGEVPDPFGH
jgi:peptide deformylase